MIPYTREELQSLIPQLKKKMDDIAAEQPHEVRPLPTMNIEECKDYFFRLMDIAAERPLTQAECFIHGQLLSCFQMAVKAEMLGKKGRYFVFGEDEIKNLMGK